MAKVQSISERESVPLGTLFLADCEESDQDCPKCHKAKLKIVTNGTNPDDVTTALLCPSCGHTETD